MLYPQVKDRIRGHEPESPRRAPRGGDGAALRAGGGAGAVPAGLQRVFAEERRLRPGPAVPAEWTGRPDVRRRGRKF